MCSVAKWKGIEERIHEAAQSGQQRENKLGKKRVKRTPETQGTIKKGLVFMSLAFKKERTCKTGCIVTVVLRKCNPRCTEL